MKNTKELNQEQKGITLIALVIFGRNSKSPDGLGKL